MTRRPRLGRSVITRGTPCARCGATLDRATPIERSAVPKEGDISFCAYCGAIAAFDADGKRRILTLDEIRALPEEVRDQLATAEVARRYTASKRVAREALKRHIN